MNKAWQTWLQEGLRAQQAGRADQARAAYLQVLRLQPEHPDACQLLGMLARQQGDALAAEQWLRRSLAAQPAQPQVWNRLGNLQLAAGRAEDALQSFDEAVRLQAQGSDALYNRARALHALGRLPEATESLDAAFMHAAAPGPAMLQLRAQLQTDTGQLQAALATLDTALLAAPERAALWHNRAVVLQRLHRHGAALQAHQQAAHLGLDVADAHYNLGNTLQSLGRLEDAAAAYRTALQRQPQHGLALLDLARLRWRLDQPDFDAELRHALQLDPATAEPAGILGHLLLRAERWADAAEIFQEGLRRAPQRAAFHDGLGRSLVRLGQAQAGLAAHARALALAPGDPELHCTQASSLLVCGQTQVAEQAAERACALAPGHQLAQALRQLAWRLQGDARAPSTQAVRALVQVIDLPLSPGGPDTTETTDTTDTHQGVAALLRALHADRSAPIDQTLRGGTQTQDHLFDQQHPGLAALQARIAEAVTAAVAALSSAARAADGPDRADPADPFLSRLPARPEAWKFSGSWSSRLTRQGFHTDHVHPQGWMSAVYYVAVPAVASDTARRQGWLRFGVPDLPLPGHTPDSLVQHLVQPVPGRLVLFPSMLWHGTTPFDEDAERITLAFDVVPV